MNRDDQTAKSAPDPSSQLPVGYRPEPLTTHEYFIKFKGFKIGDKNRQPNSVQMLQDATSAQQALAQLEAVYDIQEIIDIKKL